ncbi:hypothetical protein U1Q18_008993 [Sarracenia purpurea var. burkii]
MAEEFQAGVCGSTWWNSPRSSLGLLPFSTAISDHMGSFGWPAGDLVDMKARSSDESGSVSDGSTLFQDIQKPQQPQDSSAGGVWMDSTLLMMGVGLSSPSSTSTTDWNQSLLGRSESNYNSPMLQEDMDSRHNFRQETRLLPLDNCPQIQKEWSTVTNLSAASCGQNSTINEFKQTNQGFSLDDPRLDTVAAAGSFPMSSTSYGFSSNLLQTLFDTDPQPQQSLFDNRSLNYPSTTNYQTNSNDFSPSPAKFPHLLRPSPPENTPFWNSSTGFFPSTQAQFDAFEGKPSHPNLTAKPNGEVVQDSCSVGKKNCEQPVFKRPRIETPLPTFKVRKEKLGDRVTALQQLVSPFGKTDTASVLQEAIEYIKYLHDQTSNKVKDTEEPKQDLRSRGLCLMPVSSTFPVANETTADFWTPTFGGTFR